ncbi:MULTISPECIES: LexA family transcriptional regulator [Rathayibacter]|jgi:DNA polymerase V|uniref:Translesion error-prone DNA polymerase V autoproteolytic subunit n=1 Tax=Rathayibacter festucae TaxID=110937 RepID=A0ABX6GZ90_9MICO|nr:MULTISPECIES: translesion error-prone DNA polymerase V autoproteolytic subunit [Rathayibacter]MCJ1674494.1 translesion error-prone DNA polymerase V autoproteolytic subunit [Rathayibacter sp. VKM Ac-2929]MCJ1684775.1 translesion error-prone DNA polymerase V autoproteolytic subunit [Rathayibacter sp. VKM Ac-2928]MCJ1687411.1 translesion error-prone DNA polymerase V autoproteolytic subunit [Rathayibacter sp. VKM Ac-2927]MCJ1705540.1 translesion error-prone DNA polymerase V autoproteolytic subun
MSVTVVDRIATPARDAVAVSLLVPADAVAAGFPSPAQDYFDGSLDLNDHLIRDKTSTFIVRVSGESMTGAGISDGDELVVDRSLTPTHGSVVIAILDGELTVKRLELSPGGVVLRAENPDYPPILVAELSDLQIWGVVTVCLHRLHRAL